MLLSIEEYDIFTLVSRVNKWVNTLHNSYHIHSLSQEECVGEEVNKDNIVNNNNNINKGNHKIPHHKIGILILFLIRRTMYL